MRRIVARIWHALGPYGGDMPTPADMPTVRAVLVPLTQLTDADWADVFTTLLPEWRRHRRCGHKSTCWRNQASRFDYLLDEWLEAHREPA